MSLGHLPPRLSDAEALALGRLIEPELHAALVTVDAHGADLQLPKVWPDDSRNYVHTHEPEFTNEIRPDRYRIIIEWEEPDDEVDG